MHIKRFIISLLFVCWAASAGALKVEELFIKMPDNLIIQLEEAWRKDIVDLYRAGKPATLENTMQGRSTLLNLTDDYMLLQVTERTTVELKCLPLVNNTHVICMITTVSAPVADSRIDVYTTEWQPLSAESLYTPVNTDSFWREDVDSLSPAFIDAKAFLDMCLIKYSLSADNTTLTAEYMTPQYLDSESRKKVEPLLKAVPKVYEWKFNRFE